MNFKGMTLDIRKGVAHLTFTDVVRGNPIDGDFCSNLCEVANQISENPEVRCVLIMAEGDNFSFGGDINAFIADFDGLPQNIKRWTSTLHSGISRLQRMDAPIVTAVQGVCAGGMSAFVAGSDIVVAADNVQYVAAYAGIGYSCDAGSSIMFTRRMGLARARKFLLLNETLNAQEALSIGLADEVLPLSEVKGRAEEIASQLAQGPTKAYGEIRRLLLSAQNQPLETQLEMEALGLARIAGTKDAKEGLTAFSKRRKPVFTGS